MCRVGWLYVFTSEAAVSPSSSNLVASAESISDCVVVVVDSGTTWTRIAMFGWIRHTTQKKSPGLALTVA